MERCWACWGACWSRGRREALHPSAFCRTRPFFLPAWGAAAGPDPGRHPQVEAQRHAQRPLRQAAGRAGGLPQRLARAQRGACGPVGGPPRQQQQQRRPAAVRKKPLAPAASSSLRNLRSILLGGALAGAATFCSVVTPSSFQRASCFGSRAPPLPQIEGARALLHGSAHILQLDFVMISPVQPANNRTKKRD